MSLTIAGSIIFLAVIAVILTLPFVRRVTERLADQQEAPPPEPVIPVVYGGFTLGEGTRVFSTMADAAAQAATAQRTFADTALTLRALDPEFDPPETNPLYDLSPERVIAIEDVPHPEPKTRMIDANTHPMALWWKDAPFMSSSLPIPFPEYGKAKLTELTLHCAACGNEINNADYRGTASLVAADTITFNGAGFCRACDTFSRGVGDVIFVPGTRTTPSHFDDVSRYDLPAPWAKDEDPLVVPDRSRKIDLD